MLELPMIKVGRSRKTEKKLLQKVREWIERDERSPGIHVSDLLDPLYAYMQRVHGRKLTDREVTIFLVGHILHAFVISSVDDKTGTDFASDTGSRFSKKLGIAYSIDSFKGDIPREIKTSRYWKMPKKVVDLDTYLEQLLSYMAAEEKLVGQLWILYINTKDSARRTAPQFRCYTIRWTKPQMKKFQKQMVATRKKLERAVKIKSPKGLPLCRQWKCGEKYCQYFKKQCKPPGRYGVRRDEWEV